MLRVPEKRGSLPLPEVPTAVRLQIDGNTFQGTEVNVGNNNVSIGTVHGNVHLSTAAPTTHSKSVRIPLADWLSPLDFGRQQSEALERRTEGTFNWLLETPEFTTWRTSENGEILLCIGKPGAGKTTFASFVIDYLQQQHDTDSQNVSAVCYVYCRYHTTFTLLQLLELVLKQLILQCPSANIERLQKLKDQGRRPTVDEVVSMLQANFSQIPNVFIVIDAMDECFTEDVRHRLLSILQSWDSVKVLITSRPIPTIQNALPGATILIIFPNTTDIGTHIQVRTRHNPNLTTLVPKVSSTDLETKVVEQADGMFLLVELHIQHLSEQTNVSAFLSALEALPTEASTTYARALERINQQKPEVKRLALSALSWIFHAKRPLVMIELQHGIASARFGRPAKEDDLDDESLIISSCAGLLIVNNEMKAVSFIHYTVWEYFEQNTDQFLPVAEITKCCLMTLSVPGLQLDPPSHPLINYTVSYWGFLVESAQHDDAIITAALLNLETSAHFAAIWAATSDLEVFRLSTEPSAEGSDPHPLHLAAAFGLKNILRVLLEKHPLSAGQKDLYGRTPLHFAAQRGHVEVVKMLLDAHVEIDGRDTLGRTPLLLATEYGHLDVARLLLDTNQVDVNAVDLPYKSSPFLWAAINGQLDLVRLLLDHPQVELQASNNFGESALSLAVRSGNIEVVKTFLALEKVKVDIKDNEGGTPLHWAAALGNSDVVRLLLEDSRVDVDTQDETGESPLSVASRNGYTTIVQLLFATGKVQVDRKNKQGRTPLSFAAGGGHLDVVQFLLESAEVDVNTIDSEIGSTPLLWAALDGHLHVIKLFLDNVKIDRHARNQLGQSALFAATQSGNLELVELLLTAGFHVDAKDDERRTPFHWAAAYGHSHLVRALLDNPKVDVDAPDKGGQSPLSIASTNGCTAVVQLLLSTGKVQIDRKDHRDQTPLSLAAKWGHADVVKLLLDTGRVDINVMNSTYQATPLSYAVGNGHLEVVMLLCSYPNVTLNTKNEFGQPPLFLAISAKHTEVAKFLLTIPKVDISVVDEDGITPLWEAAGNGHLELVKLLAEKAERDIDRPDNSGTTPLGIAAFNGHYAVVQFLLDTGRVDMSAVNERGRTPLWAAAMNGHLDAVKLLAENAEHDIDRSDKFGITPLAAASGNGHFAVAEFLFNTGKVDLNATDENDETILSLAASSGGSPAIVNLLLQTGPGKSNINAKDKHGGTALMFAASWARLEVVKLLLDLPAIDIDARDLKGHTAVFYAAQCQARNPIAVLDLLLNDPRIAKNLTLHHLRPIKRSKPQTEVLSQRDPSLSSAQKHDFDPVCPPESVDNRVGSGERTSASVPSVGVSDDTGLQRQNVASTQKLAAFVLGSIFALVLALRLTRGVSRSE